MINQGTGTLGGQSDAARQLVQSAQNLVSFKFIAFFNQKTLNIIILNLGYHMGEESCKISAHLLLNLPYPHHFVH